MKKTACLVKKEYLFPNVLIFKRINKWYWNLIFNNAKGIIKTNSKKKNFLVVCDIEQYSELKKMCKNTKIFEDYANAGEEYVETYSEANRLVGEWLNRSQESLRFEGYNLAEIIKEEMTYEVMPRIDQFNILGEIKEKDDVKEFICFGQESSLTRMAKAINKTRVINFFAVNYIKKMVELLRNISLEIRGLFPYFLNNLEFVKTDFKPNKKEKKILFSAWDSTDFNRLNPLIEKSEKQGEKFLVLANYRNLQEQLKNKKIHFFSLGDFLYKKDKIKLKKEKKELVRKWKKLRPLFKKEMSYKGYPFWGVFGQELEHFFLVRIPWVMRYIRSCENIFLENNVNMVVSMGDLVPSRRSLIEVAKRSNIPSIGMQEGVFIRKIKMGIFPIVADFKILWGEASRRLLLKLGADPKRMIICGGIRLDKYKSKREINPDIYKKLGFKKGQRFFLVATQPHEDTFIRKENMEVTKKMIEILRFFPEEAVVFKLHPREDRDIAESILGGVNKELENKIKIVKEIEINELITASDIVFTVNSTTGVEAMILGKPVIVLDLFNVRKKGYYEKFNAVRKATNERELIEAIKKSLDKKYLKEYQKKTKRFLKWVCYRLDEKATERAFSLILRSKK